MRALAIPGMILGAMVSPSAALSQEDKPVLSVLTYDSFVSEWGPGPIVEAAFEAECGCDLRYVTGGDGAALLARLQLEGSRSDVDVVLGLDTNLTAAAEETGLFAPHGLSLPPLDLPVAWEDETFLPYDWSWFAFVHDRDLADVPTSLDALADSDTTILIQDPRSSTPGLGLLLWVKVAYGDRAYDVWERLSDNIVTVTPGWSEAYGLFMEGEADMVLSYATSPAYHLIAEEDDSKAAAAFDEGHYLQVEVAGRLAASDQPALAQEFLSFMLGEEFQAAIPETNWMYPARTPEGGLPEGFETLLRPRTSLLLRAKDVTGVRDAALDEWRNALSR